MNGSYYSVHALLVADAAIDTISCAACNIRCIVKPADTSSSSDGTSSSSSAGVDVSVTIEIKFFKSTMMRRMIEQRSLADSEEG
jgi:hypothetical protein